MEILNRWGDVLFSTADFATGWDGTYKDQYVPEGTYGYVITIQDGSGRYYDRQGLVHVLNGE